MLKGFPGSPVGAKVAIGAGPKFFSQRSGPTGGANGYIFAIFRY